jgi:hypothetical protein
MSMGRMKPKQGELWVATSEIKAPGPYGAARRT